MPLSFAEKLQNYAELAVKVGVGLQAGQTLLIKAPIEAAPLVRLLTASAYQAGAHLVDLLWHDDALTLARFKYAPRDSFEEFAAWRTEALTRVAEAGGATLSIFAKDPDLLKGQDQTLIATTQRVYDEHMLPFRRKAMKDEVNWSVISQPIPAWAAKVFPDALPDESINKLWEAIFAICRADQPDPVAAWRQHSQTLDARRAYLNDKQYTALSYTAPGTDFTVGLPPGHIWHGGGSRTTTGIEFMPNIPTEEVFTLPHRNQAEGIVCSTKPLSYAGVLIEDFCLTFEAGRIVRATAKKGERTLQQLIETDEGAARLGEVALVPYSSPISQSGLLFYNTLYDENAASHLAIGRAYAFCLAGGKGMSDEEFMAAGGNHSLTHVDFMIGTQAMDIDGITTNGDREPVMRAGEWAF